MMDFTAEDYVVKAVKEHNHREGRYFSGNLYKGGTKIAIFEEMGHGGPMNISPVMEEMYENFVSFARVSNEDISFEQDAVVIENLVNTFSIRKQAIAGKKKFTFVGFKSDPLMTIKINTPYSERTVDWLLKEYPNEELMIANEVFDIYPNGVDRVYRDEM